MCVYIICICTHTYCVTNTHFANSTKFKTETWTHQSKFRQNHCLRCLPLTGWRTERENPQHALSAAQTTRLPIRPKKQYDKGQAVVIFVRWRGWKRQYSQNPGVKHSGVCSLLHLAVSVVFLDSLSTRTSSQLNPWSKALLLPPCSSVKGPRWKNFARGRSSSASVTMWRWQMPRTMTAEQISHGHDSQQLTR